MLDIKRIEKGLWWDRNLEILNGCSKVSPGCTRCFAEDYIHRFKTQKERWQGLTNEWGHWTGVVKVRPEKMDIPLKIKKPTVWFVTERGDLFHPSISFDFILRAFAVMKKAGQHNFLILTKRPERAVDFCAHWGLIPDPLTGFTGSGEMIPGNIFWGTTVEHPDYLWRVEKLLQIPGKKFLSIEPMLSEINLTSYIAGIDWVVAGCESGNNARPMEIEWAESIVDQCQQAGVKAFVKQIQIRGKLVKDISQFPLVLRYRELPW